MKSTILWDITPRSPLKDNRRFGETYYLHVGFEVLTAVFMKSTIFWDISPCSPLEVNRRFGGTRPLHLQGWRISWAGNQRESRWLCFHAGFLLGLFFNPEDGGNMFLRNFGWFSTDYTALYPRRWYSLYYLHLQSSVDPYILVRFILHTIYKI
jgi:hypothetical protein